MEKVKQEIVGTVVSDKNNKTITVAVTTSKKHPLYKKQIKSTKKYTVHDEENIAKVGDKVRAVSSKPLSKTKRYVLAEVVEKAVIL